jgi:nitroreductase
MKNEYYSVTFDTSGSTSVRARTADDAIFMGEQFTRNGRTNVQITTPDARSFTLQEFQATIEPSEGPSMSSDSVNSTSTAGLDLLSRRASTARFSEAGPTQEQLDLMLAAAVTAADHGRLRPWRFVVMQGKARERLGDLMAEQVRADNPEALEKDLERARVKALRAPVVIALICKPKTGHKVPVIEQQSATAAAGAHLMLAANALGFGAAWKTGAPAYHPSVRSGLGLADDDLIIGFFYIGSDAQPAPLARATIDSVVEYWPA